MHVESNHQISCVWYGRNGLGQGCGNVQGDEACATGIVNIRETANFENAREPVDVCLGWYVCFLQLVLWVPEVMQLQKQSGAICWYVLTVYHIQGTKTSEWRSLKIWGPISWFMEKIIYFIWEWQGWGGLSHSSTEKKRYLGKRFRCKKYVCNGSSDLWHRFMLHVAKS